MSLFRRNIISVYRFPPDSGIDSNNWSYMNFDPDSMVLILDQIDADIQKKSTTSKPAARLPGDVAQAQIREIFVNADQNSIRKGDIVVDMTPPFDVEITKRPRYQVTDPYWTVFQYQLYCEELQT